MSPIFTLDWPLLSTALEYRSRRTADKEQHFENHSEQTGGKLYGKNSLLHFELLAPLSWPSCTRILSLNRYLNLFRSEQSPRMLATCVKNNQQQSCITGVDSAHPLHGHVISAYLDADAEFHKTRKRKANCEKRQARLSIIQESNNDLPDSRP